MTSSILPDTIRHFVHRLSAVPIWNHRLLLGIIMLSAYQFAIAIAAPIAAAIAILGVVVVRGTKITEFRQAWINAQRDDLAVIVSNARRLVRNANGDNLFEAWLALDAAMVRVRLRRNPKVTWYRRLFRKNRVEWLDVIPELDTLERALRASPPDVAAAETALTNIVDRSAPHLKREWNRTRNGELGFRIYITLAPALILSPLIVAIGWLLDRWLGLGWLPNVPFVDTLPLPPK